jgi:hypothetical protein
MDLTGGVKARSKTCQVQFNLIIMRAQVMDLTGGVKARSKTCQVQFNLIIMRAQVMDLTGRAASPYLLSSEKLQSLYRESSVEHVSRYKVSYRDHSDGLSWTAIFQTHDS